MIIEQASGSKKITILQLIQTFVGNAWTLLTTGANSVVPAYAGLAANGIGASGYANIDIVLTPKGTGALMASTPDNIAVGGNKRGTYAVDWQMQRTLASQVASGTISVIGGGQNNLSPGTGGVVGGGLSNSSGAGLYSGVHGGTGNVAISNYTFIGGGQNNTMTGSPQFANIGGGNGNLISNALYGVISGGNLNLVDGTASYCPGGDSGTTRTLQGCGVYAAGKFSVQGDAQWRDTVYRRQTVDATPVFLHTDGSGSDLAANMLCLPIHGAYSFVIELVAKSAADKAAFFEIRGLLQVGATAATTALVGSPSGAGAALFQDAALSGIAVAITANTTFSSINIQVTGLAATVIKWVARVRTVEVIG